MEDTTATHRNTAEEKRKVHAIAEAANREAKRQGVAGIAIVVVLDDEAPLLTGAVIASTEHALAALLLYGAEQLQGTLERLAEDVRSAAAAEEPRS